MRARRAALILALAGCVAAAGVLATFDDSIPGSSKVIGGHGWPEGPLGDKVSANAAETLAWMDDHPLATVWRRIVVHRTVLTLADRPHRCDVGSDADAPGARDWLVVARDEILPGVPIGRTWLNCAATGYSRVKPERQPLPTEGMAGDRRAVPPSPPLRQAAPSYEE